MNHWRELEGLLAGAVVTDGAVIEGYRRDTASCAAAGVPRALVRPSTTGEVQALARWASRYRVPLVPRGAGTASLAATSTPH